MPKLAHPKQESDFFPFRDSKAKVADLETRLHQSNLGSEHGVLDEPPEDHGRAQTEGLNNSLGLRVWGLEGLGFRVLDSSFPSLKSQQFRSLRPFFIERSSVCASLSVFSPP